MIPQTTAPLWPYLLLNAAVAICVAFSGIHSVHNSDSLVFSLNSLYAWTPYFWQQDRVGMLIPLIASICSDPVLNVVLQTGLTTFAALCLPLFLAELVYPHPISRIAATAANAVMFLFMPDRLIENLLFECYYPQAMTLGCGALLILGRGPGWPSWWRIVLAAGLFLLACWVYIGVPLWLGPLALLRGWLQPGEEWPPGRWRAVFRPALHPRTMLGCVLLVVAFGVGLLGMKAAQRANPLIEPTPRTGLPPNEWLESWRAFAEHLVRLPGMAEWSIVLLAAAGVGIVAALILRRPLGYPVLAGSLVLFIPAAIEYLFIGTREWTVVNDHHPRYLLGSLECMQTMLALVAVLPLASFAAGRGRWVMGVLAALALFAAATARYGLPSPERPRRELDALAGRWTADLIAAKVDAIGGDYWTVWPAVYHMNLTRREAGDSRVFCGVVLRGRELLSRRFHQDELRVAVLNNEIERSAFLNFAADCGVAPPVKIGEHGPFEIYLTRMVPAAP
jgi:hypothetical protein